MTVISQREIEDSEGQVATIYGVTEDEKSFIVQMQDQKIIFIPIEHLKIKDDDRYFLSHSFRELIDSNSDQMTIPVIQETPVIKKQKVETESIRLKKSVQEIPHQVEEFLAREEYQIERVNINEVRDQPASMRTEGDITVIPVQEEILVKKILVREEIRIKKVRTERNEKVTVNLKKEDLQIERKKLN